MEVEKSRFKSVAERDADFERRWIFPGDRDVKDLIDTFDKLRALEAALPPLTWWERVKIRVGALLG